jgi:hypothetical protein
MALIETYWLRLPLGAIFGISTSPIIRAGDRHRIKVEAAKRLVDAVRHGRMICNFRIARDPLRGSWQARWVVAAFTDILASVLKMSRTDRCAKRQAF